MLVIGVWFHFDQAQIGVGVGGKYFFLENKIFALSGDFSSHFGGSSQKTGIRPWYIKGGLSERIDSPKDTARHNYPLGIYFRIGRGSNISSRGGLNIESDMIIGKLASEFWGNLKILPSLGIFFFYRI